ncbi:MAG: 50S ribosomal protein L15, partial [Proteobacteria bacterium]|nr:50S ribosomal protein L15 [Pseudomonadota bacterium]
KGQSSRSGYGLPAGFEGGQMPIYRRLPKVGFTSRKRVMGVNTFKILNLDDLTVLAEKLNTANISVSALVEGGVINANTKVKVLAGGEKLAKKISVEVHAISESAKKAIEAAGGDVKLV